MKDFSVMVKSIQNPASMAMAQKVQDYKRSGLDIIDLSIGQPDFPPPESVVKACRMACDLGYTRYTSARGIPELKAVISEHIKSQYGVQYYPDTEILVTPGAKQAIFYALMALLDKGDQVIAFEPCWLSYKDITTIAGGEFVSVDTYEKNNFTPDIKYLKSKINRKTKAIILNNPSNPTGQLIGMDCLEEISRIAVENDLYLICDDIYDRIVFYGNAVHSIAAMPGMRNRTIIINGFSKTYSMTGFRIGYAAATKAIIDMLCKVHEHTATCAPSISQYAALEALKGSQESVENMVREYQKRSDFVFNAVNSIQQLSCLKSQGTFYSFINIMKTGMKSDEAVNYLLTEAKVATTSGRAYGASGEGFIRISFATSLNNLERAFENIRRVFNHK